MNGKTDIDEILNPCSSKLDKKTYGCKLFNVSFFGRLIKLQIARLTIDIYNGESKAFTAMGGGANGSARYWQLFWRLGLIQFITKKPRIVK